MAASSDDVQSLREALEAKSREAALLQADASGKARQIRRLMHANQAAETQVEKLEVQLASTAACAGSPSSESVENRSTIKTCEAEGATWPTHSECPEDTNKGLKEKVRLRETQIEELKREMKAADSSTGHISSKDAVIKRLEARLQEHEELKNERKLATSLSLHQVSKANDVRIEQLEAERDAAKSRAERLEAVVKRIDVRVQERDSRIQELKNQLSSATASCHAKDASTQVQIHTLEAERDAAETRAEGIAALAKRLEEQLQERIGNDRLDSRLASQDASLKRIEANATNQAEEVVRQQAEETVRQCHADLESVRNAEALARSHYQIDLNSEARLVAEYRGKLTAEARSFATAEAKLAAESGARLRWEESCARAREELNTQAEGLAQAGKHTLLATEKIAPGTGGSFLDGCCHDDDSAVLRGQLDKLHAEVRSLSDELVAAQKEGIAKNLQIAVAKASTETEENELKRLRESANKLSETTPDLWLEACARRAGALHVASPNRSRRSNSVQPMPADLGGLAAARFPTFNQTAMSPSKSPGKSPGNKRSPILAVEAEEFPSTPAKHLKQMTRDPSTPPNLSKVEEYPLTPVAKQLQDRDREIGELRLELLSMTARLSPMHPEVCDGTSSSQKPPAQVQTSDYGTLQLEARIQERVEEAKARAALVEEEYALQLKNCEDEMRNLRSEVCSTGGQLFSARQELLDRASEFQSLQTEAQSHESARAAMQSQYDSEIQGLQLEVSKVASHLASAQLEERVQCQKLVNCKTMAEKLELQSLVQKSELSKMKDPLSENHHVRSELSSMTSQLEHVKQELSQKTFLADKLQLEAEMKKSEIATLESEVLLNGRLSQDLQEHGRKVEAQALLAKDALEKQCQSCDQEIQTLRSQTCCLGTHLASAEQQLSDKTSIIEDLEVQAQIQEHEIVDSQGQIDMKNKLIKHLQREVQSQKELICIMKDAEQVYSQLFSESAMNIQ